MKKSKTPKEVLYRLDGAEFIALLERHRAVFIKASTLVNSYLLIKHLVSNRSLVEDFQLETSSLSNIITQTLNDIISEGIKLDEQIRKLGTPIKEH